MDINNASIYPWTMAIVQPLYSLSLSNTHSMWPINVNEIAIAINAFLLLVILPLGYIPTIKHTQNFLKNFQVICNPKRIT